MSDVVSKEAFDRAVLYPYTVPKSHFRFDPRSGSLSNAGHARIARADLVRRGDDASFYRLELELDGQHHLLPEVCPVVSAGSNSAPQQLHRKFHEIVDDPVYALRCRISGWVPVYSAHLSGYGAVAGCLQAYPGAQSDLFVNLLTPAGLARMHETETLGVHYLFSRLSDPLCLLHDAVLSLDFFYYECLQGALLSALEAPILLAAFEVSECALPRMNQEQVLRAALHNLFPDLAWDVTLARILASVDLRKRTSDQLKSLRIPLRAG